MIDFLPRVPIICFHDISSRDTSISISEDTFEKIIAYLHSTKNTSISLSEFISKVHAKEFSSLKNSFLITFDDGMKSIKESAFPIMEKYDVKGNIFLASDHIGAASGSYSDGDPNIPLLGVKELQDLTISGWEIHAHSHSHAHIKDMSVEEVRKDFEKNIEELRPLLTYPEKFLTFAYPFNEYDEKLQEIASDYFAAAFTADGAPYRPNQDNHLISRIEPYPNEPFLYFKYRLQRVRVGNLNLPV